MTQQTPAIFPNNGLASYGEASPEYELAPLGIASMQGQAQKLAEFGRNGDIYVIHAAEGETVIPMEVLAANPQIKALLFNQMAEMGLDPQSYIVGDQLNSINPVTGMPEFFFKSIFKSIGKAVKKVVKVAKKIAPIALPIIMSFTGFPAALGFGAAFGPGTIGAAALSSGIGSLIGGGSLKDAFKSALISGGTAGILGGLKGWAGAPEGTGFSGFGAGVKSAFTGQTPIYNAAGELIGTQAPPTLEQQWDDLWGSGVKGGGGTFTPEAGYSPPTAPAGPGGLEGPVLPPDWHIDPVTGIPRGAERFVPSGTGGSEPSSTWFGNLLGGAADTTAAVDPAKAAITRAEKILERSLTAPEKFKIIQTTPVADAGGSILGGFSPTKMLGLSAKGSTVGDIALGLGTTYALGGFDTAKAEEITTADIPSLGERRLTLAERQALADEQQLSPDALNPFLFSAAGGSVNYPDRDLLVEGPGTERSDDIPAMLSDGEFVINSRAVRGADPSGGGDRYAGAQNLYNIMRNFEMRA